MAVLRVERVDVGPKRIDAVLRVLDRKHARTSAAPELSARVVELLPGLARHTCENGSAHGALAEFADTETAHLLEHVACELMALAGSPRTLRGETAWDFSADGPGVYHVRLDYDDDLVCLGALSNGVGVIEWLFDPAAEKPDVDRIVLELASLRQRPA